MMEDDEENSDVQKLLQREARIEARKFARVFSTPDGMAVLDSIKRDFGWDAPHPPLDKDGEISGKRVRAWIGSRAVIATVIHKISMGEKLIGNPNHNDNENE